MGHRFRQDHETPGLSCFRHISLRFLLSERFQGPFRSSHKCSSGTGRVFPYPRQQQGSGCPLLFKGAVHLFEGDVFMTGRVGRRRRGLSPSLFRSTLGSGLLYCNWRSPPVPPCEIPATVFCTPETRSAVNSSNLFNKGTCRLPPSKIPVQKYLDTPRAAE